MFKACPACRRDFKVNLDDETIRRHWCLPEVGDSKTLTFATGGMLRLRLEANWMLFGEAERALLTAMIEAMATYEQEHPSPKCDEAPAPLDAVARS